jgi:transposase InsO family protein
MLMRELDLHPCQRRPWRPTTTLPGDTAGVSDLVGRDFTADAPGSKLVGDITYIDTWQGWLYLATVIDCHTKACIGYAMAEHMRAELVVEALAMAARNYRLAENAIFHSDRGTQYTSEAFVKAARTLGIRRSVGRTGVCFDNALAESFNAAVKVERVNRTVYPTREHARKDVTRYIEFRYNTQRLHSGLGYKTPQEVYNEYLNQQQAA